MAVLAVEHPELGQVLVAVQAVLILAATPFGTLRMFGEGELAMAIALTFELFSGLL